MRYSFFLAFLILLLSTAGFAGEGEPCPEGAGGGSTGGSVSVPPSEGGGGTGGGSTMDQMGKSFDPKAGGGGGDPLKNLLKSESKGSKSLMESQKKSHLSKLEKQVQADKANFRRMQDRVQEAGRDLQKARDEVRQAELGVEGTNPHSPGYTERLRGRIDDLKQAVREEVQAEERFSEVEKKGLEALEKVGESAEHLESARGHLGGSTPDAQSAPPPSR